MRIVHTIKNINENWIYDINNLRCWLLSFLLVRDVYDNVDLYTDSIGYVLAKRLKLPYNNIYLDDDINKFSGKTFSVPKLITFSKQTDPFLHIDHDTFIFKHLGKINEKIVVAHPDVSILKIKSNSIFQTFDLKTLIGFNKTYINFFEHNIDKLNSMFIDNLTIDYIPNMNIFGGNSVRSIINASKKILEIYYKNPTVWDMGYYNACIIEQLFMIPMLKKTDDVVNDFDFNFKNNKNDVILELKPHQSISISDDSSILYLNGVAYPFDYVIKNKLLFENNIDWIHVSYLKNNVFIVDFIINHIEKFKYNKKLNGVLYHITQLIPEIFDSTSTDVGVNIPKLI